MLRSISGLAIVALRVLGTSAGAAWVSEGPAEPGSHLELVFALKQQNVAVLKDKLLQISDPLSPQYGHWLSQNEVQQMVAPHQDHVDAVLTFIRSKCEGANITWTPNKDFISVSLTAESAERLVGVPYHQFVDPVSKQTVLRTVAAPALDLAVSEALDFVSPTTLEQSLPPMSSPIRSIPKSKLEDVDEANPTTMRAMYKVGTVEGTNKANKQAVTGFLDQHYSPQMLQAFFKEYYPKAMGRTLKMVGDGGTGNVGIEADLDTSYIMAMGGGVPTEFWTFSGNAPGTQNEPFLKFLTALASETNPPLVISMSYSEPEDMVPAAYASRCNTEFMKAGARGITLLVSSGDMGVSGELGCGSKCPASTGDPVCLVPRFPPSSPWITVVGGTSHRQSADATPEYGWSMSSGGFSDREVMPSYQAQQVKAYLDKYGSDLPATTKFNTSGRAFPDVSAMAMNCATEAGGWIDGTSCSAPVFAGILSLVNDLRLTAGKPSLGFANPLFYKTPTAFNDITSGNNPGCYTQGFKATPGWDGVTGLGTPNYENMAKLLTQLVEPSLQV